MTRKSIIKKGIHRELNTATFEQLHIKCEIEEEVEWDSISKRQEASVKITQLLLKDYKETETRVLKELGLCSRQHEIARKDRNV